MRLHPVAALAILLVPAAVPAAVTGPASVAVRVYDPGGSERLVAAALAAAAPSLASADVDVTWQICRTADAAAVCRSPLRRGELIVRLVRGGLPRHPRATLPLGDALIDARGGGALATVYVDRVEALARAARADAATLLGRTIAHELGHLLLASRLHSRFGLMRPVWSHEDVRAGHDGDWRFTPQDAGAIHARLQAAEPNIVWGTE